MPKNALQIRRATRAEVDLAVEWAAAEGWNPGSVDAHCYQTADPKAFHIGVLNGEPVACIAVVRYDEKFGFLGFYIVKPEFRGRGLGMQIWDAGLAYLQGCSVGLDGVTDQIGNYQKSGFELAYRHLRYACSGGGQRVRSSEIVDLTSFPTELLLEYDRAFFPSPRPAFLREWISQTEASALGVINAGKLAGYGVIRPCRSGAKIGPLYANDARLAEELFRALKADVAESEPVFLDVPDANPAAMALARGHEMEVIFECARMYRGTRPILPLERIYGVTSMEVG